MRKFTRAAAFAALGFVPIALAAVVATGPSPAAATGDCRTITVDSPRAFTTSGGGLADLVDAGVVLSTPEQASKASYRHTLHNPVPLTKVTALAYTTDRQPVATGNDQIVAAYKLGIDANGDSTVDGTLVYEPLYSGPVSADAQRHNPLTGKWWFSAEPGNKQTLATFAEWAAGTGPVAFPAPEAVWFGVEQGTYNTGASTLVNDVKFAGDGVCKRVTFCAKPITPTTPPATTPPPTTPPATTPPATTPPATTQPTTSVPTEPTDDTTPTAPAPLPDGGGTGGDSLPVTGAPVAYAAGGGVTLLVLGLGVLYLVRRRRTRYVA